MTPLDATGTTFEVFEPRNLQGILLGLLLSTILWVMIGSLGWWLCH